MSAPTRVTPEDVAAGTGAPDETLWERRMRALTMRNAGATYAKIAEQFGVTTVTIRKDVRLALREVVSETAEDMVSRQRAILLDMTRANYPAALQGDLGAQSAIVKCLEHEAKLFGLYAPTRVAVGVSDTEFASQAAELIAALGLEPPRELIRADVIDVVAEEDTITATYVAPSPTIDPDPTPLGEPVTCIDEEDAEDGDWSNL